VAEVVRPQRSDTNELAEVLASAFLIDPIARYAFPNDRTRRDRLHRFFVAQLRRQYFPRGEIYADGPGRGVAMWLPPLREAPRVRDALVQLPLLVVALIQSTAMIQLARVLAIKHPREAHYYLGTIGVDPNAQGHGVGTALLQPVLSVCDEQSIPAYLESSSEKNTAFYERLGFAVTEQIRAPHDGPRIWLMWRNPRAREKAT
jgi:GNAT superfamily N-acetyltransferase